MKMLLMLILLASGWISAQTPSSRPDRSPDAALRAAYLLPKAVMKAVNDPVFASLFGSEKKESYFHTALVGMDGSVFWIHHPKSEAPIPVDAATPERWLSAFRNDLELFGIAAATNPGTQAGRRLWNALDEYGITDFFIDSSPSANGYLTSIEVALAPEFKVLRSVEAMNTPQCFLRTYFRIYQFSLADEAIRESYTFVCRKGQDKILGSSLFHVGNPASLGTVLKSSLPAMR